MGNCLDPVGVRSPVGVHIGYGSVRVPLVPTTMASLLSWTLLWVTRVAVLPFL